MNRQWRLVRDQVPQIMIRKGIYDKTEALDKFQRVSGVDFRNLLWQKVEEELSEFADNPVAEEMADILEVLEGLRYAYKINAAEVAEVRYRKRESRGGFIRGWAWDHDPEVAKTNLGFEHDNDPEAA